MLPVFVGKLDDKEIDFIAEKMEKKIYVQVTIRCMNNLPLTGNLNLY
jgi:hypothetical protein